MDLVTYNGNVNDLVTMNKSGKAVMEILDKPTRLMDEINIKYQMVQPGSVKANPKLFKGRAGQFYLASLDEREEDELDQDADINFVETLRVLPIGLLRYSRAYFPVYDGADDGGSKEPLCRSTNGIWPSPFIDEPYATQCARWVASKDKKKVGYFLKPMCPESVWINGNKPNCSLVQDWVFFDLDLRIPFILSLKSTGIGAFNKLNKKFNVLEVKADRSGHEIDDYFIRVSSSDEGTYRQLKFSFEHDTEGVTKMFFPVALWYTENVLPILGPDTITDDPQVWASMRVQENEAAGENQTMISSTSEKLSEEDKAAADAAIEEAANFDV